MSQGLETGLSGRGRYDQGKFERMGLETHDLPFGESSIPSKKVFVFLIMGLLFLFTLSLSLSLSLSLCSTLSHLIK